MKEMARKGRLDDLPSTVMHNLSTWPAPAANKHTKNSKDPSRMKENGVQTALADAVWITDKATDSGLTTSGSPEPTAKPGALNPAFPCWLMGYPTEWDDCAPMATPSSRKSRQK